MKLRTLLLPTAAAVGFAAYVALHPGVASSEPRMAASMPTPFAQQAAYTIDINHSSINFEITHLGLANIHGRINKFRGKIWEDDKDLTKSSVEFTAQVETIDTAIAARDNHLRNADFFEVSKYPELSFKSKKIARKRGGYVVTGDLTIKGKTKEVSIPFKHYGPLKGMGDQPSRIGIIAEPVTLKRSDFGVGNQMKMPDGTSALSDDLTVRLSLEGTLDK
jgi:polyisoprenoid-binding protein YceI